MAYNAEEHKQAETDFSGKAAPRFWFWKGNHKKCNHPGGECVAAMGWQRNKDAALVPVLVAMHTGKRHSVRIEEEGPTASGDVIMGWQEKGFEKLEPVLEGDVRGEQKQRLRIAGEIMAKVRPCSEIVDTHLDQGGNEIRYVAREEKWSHDLITKTTEEFRASFTANNSPKPSKQEAARGRA